MNKDAFLHYSRARAFLRDHQFGTCPWYGLTLLRSTLKYPPGLGTRNLRW